MQPATLPGVTFLQASLLWRGGLIKIISILPRGLHNQEQGSPLDLHPHNAHPTEAQPLTFPPRQQLFQRSFLVRKSRLRPPRHGSAGAGPRPRAGSGPAGGAAGGHEAGREPGHGGVRHAADPG